MSQESGIHDDEKQWKQQAEAVLSLAKKVILASEESVQEWDSYKFVARAFLNSANDNFRAIFLLVNNGLFSEAAMVLRRLFELTVNLRYISKCPEKYAERYLKFDPIERKRYVDIWSDYDPEGLTKEKREWIKTMYEEVMVDLGYEKPPPLSNWSGCTLGDRVKAVGGIWPKQHDYIYKICCIYTHVSPLGLSNCHELMPSGRLKYVQPPIARLIVVKFAVQYFLLVIGKTDEILNTSFRAEVGEIWRSIM